MKTFLVFDERSPSNNVEAMQDLVGNNPGLLAELWILNKGCWVVPHWRDPPNIGNDEIRSSMEARESSHTFNPITMS